MSVDMVTCLWLNLRVKQRQPDVRGGLLRLGSSIVIGICFPVSCLLRGQVSMNRLIVSFDTQVHLARNHSIAQHRMDVTGFKTLWRRHKKRRHRTLWHIHCECCEFIGGDTDM